MNNRFKKAVFNALVFIFATIKYAHGVPLRHSIHEHMGIFHAQSLGVCVSTLVNSDHRCNPAIYNELEKKKLSFNLDLKGTGESYDRTRNLLFEKVTRESLQSFFKDDFVSFSGAARLETLYEFFAFSFTPMHAIAAIKISNPSLPEIRAAGLTQSVFSATASTDLNQRKKIPHIQKLLVGATLFYYQREFIYISANTLDFVVVPIEEIVNEEKEQDADINVGLLAIPETRYFPNLGLNLRNIAHPGPDDEGLIEIKFPLRRHLEVGISWEIPTQYGIYTVGGVYTYYERDQVFTYLQSAGSISYRVGGMGAFASIGSYSRGFGFIFSHNAYQVGIKYSNEKQDNFIQLKRTNHVYLFAKIFL